MSLARIKTWIAGENVKSADLNAEFENIVAHPTDLISPLPAILAAGGFKITGLAAGSAAGDSVRFEDLLALATQANQETATSLTAFVTPGRQQFHPSACKAWAKADYAGTVAASFNMASVTDGGVGLQTYNLTTAFSSALFCAVGSVQATTTAYINVKPLAAGTIEVRPFTAGSPADTTFSCVAAWGDQ